MTFLRDGAAWLSPVRQPPLTRPSEAEGVSPEIRREGSDSSLRQRKRPQPRRSLIELDEIIKGNIFANWRCCKKLNCTASFASVDSKSHDSDVLKAERERIAAMSSHVDRKVFVTKRASLAPLSVGCMRAARQPVCTKISRVCSEYPRDLSTL